MVIFLKTSLMRSVFSKKQTANGVCIYHEPHEFPEQWFHSTQADGSWDCYFAAGGCDMGSFLGTYFGMYLFRNDVTL